MQGKKTKQKKPLQMTTLMNRIIHNVNPDFHFQSLAELCESFGSKLL